MNSVDEIGLARSSQSGTRPASGDTRTGGADDDDPDDLGLSRVDISSREYDDVPLLGTRAVEEWKGGWGENAVAVAPSVSTRAAAWTFIVMREESCFV
jgi:hypothetical protein